MRIRLLLLAVLMLALVGASNLAAAGQGTGIPASALAQANQSVPGCGDVKAAEAPAASSLSVFKSDPISLATGTCGSCSLDGCSGRIVGSACWTRFIGWAWCIPPETNFCPTGAQNATNWSCRCATEYL